MKITMHSFAQTALWAQEKLTRSIVKQHIWNILHKLRTELWSVFAARQFKQNIAFTFASSRHIYTIYIYIYTSETIIQTAILLNWKNVDFMSSSPSEPCLQTSSVPITQNEEQAAQQKDDSSYVLCQYDSSENEEEKALKTEHRSWIMMWTFPTPRSYLKTYEERKKKNELIPRDISREELEKNFLDALNKCQLMGKLRQMIVVYEPHKKLMPDGSAHEMHYHVCFKMSANFAHKGVSNTLAQHYGLHGHMSYPRKGWYQMAKYVLTDSAVKLPVHLDPTPLFWPTRMTKEDMLKKMQLTEEDYLKKRAEENRMQWKEESNNGDGTHQDRWRKRRRVLDFSEFSDYVLHHKITNEQEFWVLACKEKEAGNPTLWNYGGTAAVAKQIQKCNKAHMAQFRDDVFLGTSKATSKYPLSAFNIPDDNSCLDETLQRWNGSYHPRRGRTWKDRNGKGNIGLNGKVLFCGQFGYCEIIAFHRKRVDSFRRRHTAELLSWRGEVVSRRQIGKSREMPPWGWFYSCWYCQDISNKSWTAYLFSKGNW